MAIKRTLLQKQIENTLYDIYPKTEAGIVVYTKTVEQEVEGVTQNVQVITDVAAELAALTTALANANSDQTAAIQALEDKIYGLADGEEIDTYFDTLKEISDWLSNNDRNSSAQEILNNITALQEDLGVASAAAVGTEGEEGYKEAVVASGLHADVEENAAQIAAIWTAIGNRSAAAVGEPGDDNYQAAVLAAGIRGDIEALEIEVGDDPTTAGGSNGSGLKQRISDLEWNKAEVEFVNETPGNAAEHNVLYMVDLDYVAPVEP